jgi:hypothetical protein
MEILKGVYLAANMLQMADLGNPFPLQHAEQSNFLEKYNSAVFSWV